MVTIADEDSLRAFASSTDDADKQLTPELRGVLAEVATSGVLRYPWSLLRPLVLHLLCAVLAEYEDLSRVEVGPALPLPDGEPSSAAGARLEGAVNAFEAAPFTIQRLSELLLAPRKQYTRLDKLVLALEKLLLVTSTVARTSEPPPPPELASLPPVNENPKPPAIDGAASAGGAPRLANGPGVREQMPLFLAVLADESLTAGTEPLSAPGMQARSATVLKLSALAAAVVDIDRLQDSRQHEVEEEGAAEQQQEAKAEEPAEQPEANGSSARPAEGGADDKGSGDKEGGAQPG